MRLVWSLLALLVTNEARSAAQHTEPLETMNLRVPGGFRPLLNRAKALELLRTGRSLRGGVLLYELLTQYVRVAEKGGGR